MIVDTQSSIIENSFREQPLVSAPALKQDLPIFCYQTVGKRFLDVTLALLGLIFITPILAVMALLVALDGHSPLYTQERVGRNGKRFRIIKIRTMVHNADKILEDHLNKDPALRAEWASTQKLKHDVRITRVGRLLRTTSMDELPQLINVVLGSMSLVGPRPMMPSQEELYPGRAYYRLRPGITGFWQISDRNECKFRDRSKYDTAYEREMSFRTDLSVMWRTVAVVLRGTGY